MSTSGGTGSPCLPPSCRAATWRGTLPVDAAREQLGLLFDVGDQVVRLALPIRDARHVMETIGEFLAAYGRRSHSDSSSGMPSVDGSTPGEGQ